MMDVLSELQGYYRKVGTINLEERKLRFQKLSFEAQEFAFDFESLIKQKVSLENIVQKLGNKFPEKGIVNLYYTYLKVAGNLEDALVIDSVFEQKAEYVVKMIERERLRNHFREMAKKDEGQLANRMLANIDNKEMQMPKLHSLSDLSEPEVFPKPEKVKSRLNNIWIFIGLALLAFLIIYFLFK
jgi:hypothetical protein